MDTSFINQRLERVKSLQSLCRARVLLAVTLNRIDGVEKLGLPNLLKDYLCSFNIPHDFDLDGFYFDYHFNFPNHAHHKVHQIYPGRCLIDGAKILIKSQHLFESCVTCESSGKCTMRSLLDRDVWLHLRHENLMSCFLTVYDPPFQRVCLVFEFPGMTLQDFVGRMFLSKHQIPDIVTWQVLSKLSSVLIYLESNDLIPWELCHPQNVIITNDGDVKLENLLLYLPTTSGSRYQTNASKRFSPEQANGEPATSKTLVWGLGRILYEMCARMRQNGPNPEVSAMPSLSYDQAIHCTKDLSKVMCECLRTSPSSRPSLLSLKHRSERQIEKLRLNNWSPNFETNLLMLVKTLDRLPYSGGFAR